MPSSILYHCTCTSASTSSAVPPDPTLASAAYAFHPLHTLYFCEECDLVRCNRCVSVEVSGYYCPNCLFEVPSASVRAEKNRCARNCFQCPHCRNTLSVVPSDPLNTEPRQDMVGEPPFFLYCNYCRWDSAEVGIQFEKPTGLALQLQKLEDALPDSLEFERLKDHFEPLIRSSSTYQTPTHHHRSAITTAASNALAREVPGLGQTTRSVSGRTYSNPKKPPPRDQWDSAVYKPRLEAVALGNGLDEELDWLQKLDERTGIEEISTVEQRWLSSWMQSMKANELQPLRIPLHSKKTKRCQVCRHILIKPEQKAQSVRYKIKLMAANYLPAIDIVVQALIPPPAQPQKAKIKGEDDGKDAVVYMQPGKGYSFQMTFTNPLYEPIQVHLAVHRAQPRITSDNAPPPRPAFGITLPTVAFPISAFAEAWEYDEDDEMFDEDDLEEMLSGGGSSELRRKSKQVKGNVGVLERKANVTKIGGEVVISKEGKGDVKFNMQVSYTYRADDVASEDTTKKTSSSKDDSEGEMKTFTFYTQVYLGTIAPKVESDAVGVRRDSVSITSRG